MVRDLAGDFGPVELSRGNAGIEVNDLEDIEQPVKIRARGKAERFARREGDNFSVPAGATQRLVSELASLSERKLDIVLHAPQRFGIGGAAPGFGQILRAA